MRYVGHDKHSINWLAIGEGDLSPVGSVMVPVELDHVSDADLIRQFTVKKGQLVQKNRSPRTVAMISDYGVNCGIATYTKYLCDELKRLVEVKIFAEDAEVHDEDDDSVVRCWHRKSSDFSRLYQALEEYNPDLVIVQHEFGLFPKIGIWNSLMCQLSRWRVAVTFHTVLEHDVPNPVARLDYLTRSLAEAACHEIIVHTPRARKTLRARGYSGVIHYIPHGCFELCHLPKLPVTKYGMLPENIVFQYGFGGPHKGWDFAINVVEKLVTKYSDMLYLGVFNVSSYEDNASYYYSLLDLIRKKNLENNVVILRGFQSEEMLRNYLRSCKAAMFPYQAPKNWASWGASGAIQLPLSMGIPMVMSTFSAFQEFEGRLPLVSSIDEAVKVIDQIFSDKEYETELSRRAFEIAEERQWKKVAQWYLSIKIGEDFNAFLEERL